MLSRSENWARTPPAALLVEPDAELVALEQQHVGDAGLGQVEGDAGADHAAADDHDLGPLREAAARPGHSGTRVPTPSRSARPTIAQAAAASCTPRPRLL